MLLCVLCNVIYRVHISNRALLHGLCMAMFYGLFGYMMLSHQTSGDLNEMMHKIVGAATIAVAFIRIGCVFWDQTLPIIYGYLVFLAGMMFNFSNECIAEYW